MQILHDPNTVQRERSPSPITLADRTRGPKSGKYTRTFEEPLTNSGAETKRKIDYPFF